MKTFRFDNEFRFQCPSLSVEVRLADCLALRDKVWRGERQNERQGCQACMVSSKCAAAQIAKDAYARRDREIDYYSPTPKVGALDADLVAQMRRVIVPEKTLDKFMVPEPERHAIQANTGHDVKGAKTSQIDASDWNKTTSQPRRKPEPLPEGQSKAVSTERAQKASIDAAISGDMTAALNRVASKPAPAAKPEPEFPAVQPTAPASGLSLMERARLAIQKGASA